MTYKLPYTVLLIGERISAGLLDALERSPEIGEVHRAVQPYESDAILRREKNIAAVFIGMRDWSVHHFHSLFEDRNAGAIPQLVTIKGRLDRSNFKELPDQLFFKEPYTLVQLKTITGHFATRKSNRTDYDCLWLTVDRKWKRVVIDDIELLQRFNQGQLLICTTNGDIMINGWLKTFEQILPFNRFVRIGTDLIVPRAKAHRVHKQKGFPFRKGWMPVRDKTLKKLIETHEA